VVVEMLLEGESTVIGALADSVEEVVDLEPDQIEPAPGSARRSGRSLSRAWGSATGISP
jgi:purine-binding chemotaxis protein CheW